MKQKSISKTSNFFSDVQIAIALASAQDAPTFNNKALSDLDWQGAIVSYSYPELKAQLDEERKMSA